MKKISMVFVLILVLVSLSACSSDKVRTSVTTPESDSPSGLDATSSAVINDKSEVKSYEKAPSGKEKVQTPIEPVQKKEQPKEKQSEKNQIVEQPIKQTKDLTGWVEYDTSDLSLLAKYIAEGKVVKQGGKYWASPELVKMIANEEVVHVYDKATDTDTENKNKPTEDSKIDVPLAEREAIDKLNDQEVIIVDPVKDGE
jgi:hypothetical protein